jgi:hypothetical protein
MMLVFDLVQWTSGNLETWQSLGAFSWGASHWFMSLPSRLINIMDTNSPSHVRGN